MATVTKIKPAAKAARRELTTRDLERVFGVTSMTLYLWRKGTATKSKLRTARRKGRTVSYYEDDVLAFARRHGIPIVVHPSKIKPAARKQPGPHARLAA